MANKIELDMVTRPAEVALATIEQSLDRTADSLNQAGYLSAGMRESLMACVAVGKANIDGVRQMNQEVTAYAQASLDASIVATKASMKATTWSDAVAIHRDRIQDAMTDGLARSNKFAALALSMPDNTVAPLRKQMGESWAGWLKAAA